MYPKDAFIGCLSCKVDSGQNKNSLHEVDTSHSSAVRRYRRTRGAQSTFSSWISQVWTRCEAEANYFSQDKEGTLNWIMLLKGIICFLTGSASVILRGVGVESNSVLGDLRRTNRQISNCHLSHATGHFTQTDLMIKCLEVKASNAQVVQVTHQYHWSEGLVGATGLLEKKSEAVF